MYAVFQSGGKQHRVSEGQTVRLEKLDTELGQSIEFDRVFMVVSEGEIKIGEPCVPGVVVKAEVIAHGRDKKITIVKFQRRKHYRKKQGHRQSYTDVKIIEIIA